MYSPGPAYVRKARRDGFPELELLEMDLGSMRVLFVLKPRWVVSGILLSQRVHGGRGGRFAHQ